MSYTLTNRTFGYDNISAGNARGLENGQLNTEENFIDNISVGNASPENKEIVISPGGNTISPSASGTEIP